MNELIETAPVSARSTSLPPTVTAKASAAGTELASSEPSKLMVSAAPFTDADENAGGVLLVAVLSNACASLPARSLSRLEASEGSS